MVSRPVKLTGHLTSLAVVGPQLRKVRGLGLTKGSARRATLPLDLDLGRGAHRRTMPRRLSIPRT